MHISLLYDFLACELTPLHLLKEMFNSVHYAPENHEMLDCVGYLIPNKYRSVGNEHKYCMAHACVCKVIRDMTVKKIRNRTSRQKVPMTCVLSSCICNQHCLNSNLPQFNKFALTWLAGYKVPVRMGFR